MNILDIAWRAETHPLGHGILYVAIAPLVQQLAVIDLLAERGVECRPGQAVIEDHRGVKTPYSFLSIRPGVFNSFHARPVGSSPGQHSMILTFSLDAVAAERYLREAARIARNLNIDHPGAEGGFIGACGLSAVEEQALFARLPADPMPASDFLSSLSRIVAELNAG